MSDRNPWWKDVRLGLAVLLAAALLLYALAGCGHRPYVETGVYAEVHEAQASAVYGRDPACYAAIGADRHWRGGALVTDCALRHLSACLEYYDPGESNLLGCSLRVYPRELRRNADR